MDARCGVCGAYFHQLRRLALRRALGVSRARPASGGRPGGKQQRWSYEEERRGDAAPWGWGGVQSTYLGGGGVKGLATVTPLPLDAHHYLEGVWRVSCCRSELRELAAVRLMVQHISDQLLIHQHYQ